MWPGCCSRIDVPTGVVPKANAWFNCALAIRSRVSLVKKIPLSIFRLARFEPRADDGMGGSAVIRVEPVADFSDWRARWLLMLAVNRAESGQSISMPLT